MSPRGCPGLITGLVEERPEGCASRETGIPLSDYRAGRREMGRVGQRVEGEAPWGEPRLPCPVDRGTRRPL